MGHHHKEAGLLIPFLDTTQLGEIKEGKVVRAKRERGKGSPGIGTPPRGG